MFKKAVLKLAVYLLKRSTLSQEDRALLTYCVLDKLNAIPLSDIISINEQGVLLVNGHSVEKEVLVNLRNSARILLTSPAYKLIRDQVVYAAFSYGTHTATTIEQMNFSKAAIWWGQKEDEYLRTLAGLETDDE